MNANFLSRTVLLAVVAGGLIWTFCTPVRAATLAAGCACPAGAFPISGTACLTPATVIVPAICPGRNIGQIVNTAQNQSFWGVNQMLQAKRDQLQATLINRGGNSQISGYTASNLDDNTSALSYAASSRNNNPLAGNLYDSAPATASANPAWGTWLQGLGDWEHDNALVATDLAHLTSTYTVQGGIDHTQQGIFSADDAFVLGLVPSWTQAHTGFSGSPTFLDMSGPGIGVYSEYIKGGFSTDVTTKFDFLQLNENFQGAAPNQSINLVNEAVSANIQYKITGFLGSDSNFIEPTVGLTLSHISFADAAAHNLQDGYTVKLQAGARVGTTVNLGAGTSVDASLKGLIYGNAVAQGTSIAGANDPATLFVPVLSPTDAGKVDGELDPELCFNLPDNYSLTVSGQVRYGQALVGGSAGINLRKSW